MSDGGYIPLASDREMNWSLFAVGDTCLAPDRADRELLAPKLRERVMAADVATVNIEAPVEVPEPTPIPKSGPALATHPETPALLAKAGFDVATLANNHLFDYGTEGMRATVRACQEVGIDTAGVGEDRTAALNPSIVDVDGVSLAILSACEREFGIAERDASGTAWSAHPDTIDAVQAAAETYDVVVIVEHGGIEYVPFSPPQRRERLRRFVDAGADLVVGHHPHVVQGWERYDGALICYSLGNFCFDRQSEDENTGWGLAIEVEFDGATPVGADLVPVETVDGIVHPLGVERSRADHLAHLRHLADLTSDDERYRGHWQAVAVRAFHQRYSNWLLTGVGENLVQARTNPTDPTAQRALWNPERRRAELLTLLNVLRNESHRATMTSALAVLSGEREDERTPVIEETVESLLTWTQRRRQAF
ncbi:CapA family protein [Haladaptatus sp. DFWS20]|uniref:CapA family protein n=1 Tax=Haladaptatus sp. DFWS20 TaxID=3403467 RepID=UPI003EBD63CE